MVLSHSRRLKQIELERSFDSPENCEQKFGTYALKIEEMDPKFGWEFIFLRF